MVNHGVGAYDQPSKAENPYESVDGEKTNSDQQAGPSGDTSPPPGGSSGLPPVYAVVDKNKKTKKPPPKSVSRFTVHGPLYGNDGGKCELSQLGESNR